VKVEVAGGECVVEGWALVEDRAEASEEVPAVLSVEGGAGGLAEVVGASGEAAVVVAAEPGGGGAVVPK